MSSLRILYVEDEPDIRTIAHMSMTSLGGFEVMPCASGSEALQQAAAFQPELLILDVMMPGMNGPATLELLRGLPECAATPVIFMTAKVQPGEVQEYLDLGALGVIAKPFDAIALSDEILAMWKARYAI